MPGSARQAVLPAVMCTHWDGVGTRDSGTLRLRPLPAQAHKDKIMMMMMGL